MNGYRLLATTLTCLALSGSAWAQSGTMGTTGATTPQTTTTTTTTTTGTAGTTVQDPNAPYTDTEGSWAYNNEWIASGFVGGNWGQNAFQSSVDFGGTIGYLFRGVVGPEFVAGFSPKFKFDRLSAGEADINNYMINAIATIPIGQLRGFRPFVSGGIGAITMSLNSNAVLPLGPGNTNNVFNTSSNNAVFDPNASHFAGNIGVGLMAFSGNVGFRADVRYFSTIGTSDSTVAFNANGTPAISSTSTFKDSALLNDVKFWRANIGLAFRW